MAPLAPLIGRDHELGRLSRLVARDDVQLVTITGLPGVGKTRLARELLTTVTHGVLVPLDTVADAEAVGDALLACLPGHQGLPQSPAAALRKSFRGERVVIVLDGVDRVEGLGPVMSDLLTQYPAAVLVLTALQPTRLHGERVLRLAPLALPDSPADGDQPSVTLFAWTAAAEGVELELTDPAVLTQVVEVCRSTGGLPLAIELAAARTPTAPLSFIARTLGHHRMLRHDGAAGGIGASLAMAYSLLPKDAQQVLPQVAVFAGPFLLDAAAAVVRLDGSDGELYDALSHLVDAHLLDFEVPPGGGARFVLPTIVRSFALQQVEPTELSEIRRRHASYFRDRCRDGDAVVRRDWLDISAALDHSIQGGFVDDALVMAVAAAPAVRDWAGRAATVHSRIDELLAETSDRQGMALGLRARAVLWSTTLRPREAVDFGSMGLWTAQHLAAATQLARESGDRASLLEALETTVRSVRITLDLQAAVAAAHEGLELARRLDDGRAIARFEVWTALDASAREQVDEMVRLATAGLVHGRASDDPVAVIYASRLLLSLPVDLRPTVDPPLPSLHALLEQCEEHGQPLAGMVVLADLAEDAAASRDLPSAATWLWRHLMAAATVARTDPFATLGGLVAAASLEMEAGELEDAVRLRESVREFDFTLPVMMGADRARSHLHRLAALEQRVPPEHYAALAADVADRTLVEANRHAQLVTRSLSRLEAEEPRTSSDEAVDRVGLLAVERAAIQRPGVPVEPLTPREREVLAHLSSGATNSQIAAALFVSPKTVMHHAAAIYRKLGVRGRAAATAWAVREGIASG